jgi:translation initiation factor 2A
LEHFFHHTAVKSPRKKNPLIVYTMTSLAKTSQDSVVPRPKILLSDENGLALFYAPREKQEFPQNLESSGLYIENTGGKVVKQSANAGLLHGVDKPLTEFSSNGEFMAVFDKSTLTLYNVKESSMTASFQEQLGRVEHMSFSPLGTYLVTWARVYKGDTGPNLKVFEVGGGKVCKLIASYHERRLPHWPAIKFSLQEGLAARMVKNEVHIFKGCNFSENYNAKIRLEGVSVFSMHSVDGVDRFALFKPEDKGGSPARVNIYAEGNDGKFQVMASKSFYKAQDINFHWSPNGKTILLQTHTDVSKDTYYGESNLYLLHTDGSFDCTVTRTKSGPLHAVAWSPKGNEFTVISGTLPANVTVYNPKSGDPYFELGAAARNTLSYSPHGRFLCVAGFGSLRGDMDFWDMNKRKKMGSADGSCTTVFSWSPDGRWFATGSTYPRMQVDNVHKIFKYNGEGPVCEKKSQRLFDVEWVPALPGVYPDRPQDKKKKSVNNDTPLANSKHANKSSGAYRPPAARSNGSGGGRSLADMLGESVSGLGKVSNMSAASFSGGARVIPGMNPAPSTSTKSRRKKKPKKKVEAPVASESSSGKDAQAKPVPLNELSLEALQKKLKSTNKKLKQIAALKMRKAQGEDLNADQQKKIAGESDLLKTLDTINQQIQTR